MVYRQKLSYPGMVIPNAPTGHLSRVSIGLMYPRVVPMWEDIRSELAEWHEMGPMEEEKVRCISRFAEWQEEEEEQEENLSSLPSLPSIPEGEAEPAEKVRCTSGGAEWQEEEEEEERLLDIPEQDAEQAEKVRCTSATCASLVRWRSQWLGSCGCPFVLKEVAGVMVVCAVEDGNGQKE